MKHTVLFRHDPSRTDLQLDKIQADSQERMAQHTEDVEFFLVAAVVDSYQLTRSQGQAGTE